MDKGRMECWDQNSQAVSVHLPRIMIAAEKSGGGKTLFTCALLSLLKEKIREVRAFKCGPDYIDPMFHRTVLEIPSRNLDSFFADGDTLRYLLGREVLEMKKFSESRIAVLEGVMGFYDGLGGVSERSSAWEVADLTDTPVILLVDMKGRSLSALASINGFLDYKEKSHVTGIVFNRLSPMLYPGLKERAERELGIRVFGYVPELKDLALESRHLGLVMPEEIPGIRKRLDLIKEKVRAGINLDGIIEEAGRAAEIEVKLPEAVRQFCNVDCGKVLNNSAAQHIENIADAKKIYDSGNTHEAKSTLSDRSVKKTVVAVAKDEAFCFYYEDNLDLLKKLGAEIQYFSPIHDRNLPEGTCAVYLGGGYPETYRKELAENLSMKESICEAAKAGKPIIAECGGFMYVCNHLVETDDSSMDMLGLIDTDVHMTKRLSMQFGYVTLNALCDTAFFKKNTNIRAHEFHYSKADKRGDSCEIKKYSGKCWNGLYVKENIMAGYPHFYFHNCREVAERFVDMAEKISKNLSM